MTDSGSGDAGVDEGTVADAPMPRRPLRGRPKPLPRGIGASALGASSAPLAGLRVAVTRSVDRAGGMLAALESAGAEAVLVPVIDFEVSDDHALDEALGRLAAGEYRWLVISSITTVRALKQRCAVLGRELAELIPESTSVATIGPTSVAILAAEGIHAALAPADIQSAAGLVALWPDFSPKADGAGNKVLLPQSNLASPTLADGLTARGWVPEIVTAYQTVDYPARPDLRLTAMLAARSPERGASGHGTPALLTPTEAAGEIRAGAIDAVVLASGSAAKRVASTMAPLPEDFFVIAIGEPTRQESERLGLRVAATAVHPTPEGIVAALIQARTTFNKQDLQESS